MYPHFNLTLDRKFRLGLFAIAASVMLVFSMVGGNANTKKDDSGLPDPGFEIVQGSTALLITDPQNDFLSPDGVAWGVVGKNVEANGTVQNIEILMAAAKNAGLPVFISPHYYFPHDHGWKFEGALEALMHKIGMFDRKGPLSTTRFEGSGADWLNQYKKYINDGKTIVTSPHKVFGPETNDLVLQLRKQGIDKVILAGMSANLCVESHMRELIEQGFEVMVVPDATAAAQVPGYDGFAAALTNYRMIASHIADTQTTVAAIEASVINSIRNKRCHYSALLSPTVRNAPPIRIVGDTSQIIEAQGTDLCYAPHFLHSPKIQQFKKYVRQRMAGTPVIQQKSRWPTQQIANGETGLNLFEDASKLKLF